MAVRAAGSGDIDLVTRCITLAFVTDPIWGPALGRPDGRTDHLEPYWRPFIETAQEYGTVHLIDGGEAVAVWVPPGAPELTDERAVAVDGLIRDALPPARVTALLELFDRFEASRAGRPDHYYLSLLATDPAHRGRGVGQALLAADLAGWDAAGVPAYLESTNPANDHRYVRAGFQFDGGFDAVVDDARVSAMWRPVGGTPVP